MVKLKGKNPVKFADHIPTTQTLKKGQIAYDTNGDIYTSTAESYGANGIINKVTNCKCSSAGSPTTTYIFGNLTYVEEIPIFEDEIYKTSREYLPGTLELYISGLRQIRGIDYIETDAATFEITEPPNNVQLFVKYAHLGA